jgi:hypothetical protein
MIGQGQDKTRIFTRKKGWAAPARRTQGKKVEGKREREKGKGKKVEGKRGGKGKTREKQRWLGCNHQ